MSAHEREEGPEVDKLGAALRRLGYRRTPQRQLIVEALAGSTGHIAPEAISRQVVTRFPTVNRSTVYRTLELLEELGLLAHVHLDDGSVRYHHGEEAGHLHLVCHECGRVLQVDDPSVGEALAAELRHRYGFAVDLSHHCIAGRCQECARAGAS